MQPAEGKALTCHAPWQVDDAQPASLHYSVASSADLGLADSVYTPFGHFSVASSTTGKVALNPGLWNLNLHS